MKKSPNLSRSTTDTIKQAAVALKRGHLVAFPTETVYGLGADARNPQAVKRIYEVKGRPTDHPLIVHISSINQMAKWVTEIPDYATTLAKAFWPGPMTLILKRTDAAKDFITGGQDSVGIRIPNHPIALELLTHFETLGGLGIAAPSANRFGQVSPTTARDVYEELGNFIGSEDLILNGGRAQVGIESTIIDCTSDYPHILRPGAVTRANIEKCVGEKETNYRYEISIKSSGMFASHYSPKATVLINRMPQAGQGLLALKNILTPPGVIRIGSPEDLVAYARELYSALRKADHLNLREIAVFTPEGEGMAEAISERVFKAAGVQIIN